MKRFLVIVMAATAVLAICGMAKATNHRAHRFDEQRLDRGWEGTRHLAAWRYDVDWNDFRRLDHWRFDLDNDSYRRFDPWRFDFDQDDLRPVEPWRIHGDWDDLRYLDDGQLNHYCSHPDQRQETAN